MYTKENIIFFITGVTRASVDKLIRLIEDKNRETKTIRTIRKNALIITLKPNPIYLHTTIHGVSLLARFRAANAIARSKVPIYTMIDGYAASAATLMSVVGKKRYMAPRDYMQI